MRIIPPITYLQSTTPLSYKISHQKIIYTNDISIIVLPLYSPSTIFCASSYSWKKIPLSCLIKQDLHLSRYLHRNRFRPSWLRSPSPHFRPHLRLGLIYFALAAP